MIANQPNGGNDLTYIAQTAPGVTMNTGGGYGNFSATDLPATSNLFTVNGENDMDPYLNLNNSGATNLTLGKNDVAGSHGHQQRLLRPVRTAGGRAGQLRDQVRHQPVSTATPMYWWTGRSMDANDWFNNLSGTPRPFANNNQWAASIGGPIKKDKLFFFVDNEGIRYIVPSTQHGVFVRRRTSSTATLANLAANDPAALPLYQQYCPICSRLLRATARTSTALGPAAMAVATSPACRWRQLLSASTRPSPALPGTEWHHQRTC